MSESEGPGNTGSVSFPGYQPYAAPPPPPRRRRPSAWWFVLAVGLMVAGIAVGVTILVLTIKGFTETDATVAADGRPHSVSVESDEERMVWIDTSEAAGLHDRRHRDRRRGQLHRHTRRVVRRSSGGQDWVGDRTFDPGSGDLEVTCEEAGGPIQIGPAPQFKEFFGGIAIGIFVPFVLGGIGFLMLIVVVILFATGRPRKEA